jgi:succinate dehydrogenase/fumarate reductase cytochrome b subunit (b558 family)
LRQIHSLTGVIPVGLFMLLQLWVNAKAQHGPVAYQKSLGWMIETPASLQLLVLVPLAFHALYGLWLAFRSEYNITRHPYSKNWAYVLQRASGMIAFAFIAFHAYRFWLPIHREAATLPDLHLRLEQLLSSTWRGVPVAGLGYAFGVAACAFHLGNGLPAFAARWGLATSRPRRRVVEVLGFVVGVSAFALGAHTVAALATGWRVFGGSAIDQGGSCVEGKR